MAFFRFITHFIHIKQTVFSFKLRTGTHGPSRLRWLHIAVFTIHTLYYFIHEKKKLFLVPNYGLGRMDLADYDDYTIDQDFNELSEEMGDDKVWGFHY